MFISRLILHVACSTTLQAMIFQAQYSTVQYSTAQYYRAMDVFGADTGVTYLLQLDSSFLYLHVEQW